MKRLKTPQKGAVTVLANEAFGLFSGTSGQQQPEIINGHYER